MNIIGARPATAAYDRKVLVACCTAYAMANTGSWMQPFLLVEILERQHLGEAAAGLVLTVEMLALSLSSVLYARLFQDRAFRMLGIIGTLVAIGGNMLSMAVDGYGGLLAARTVAGLGEGMMLMIGMAGLARFPNPDSEYGKINAAAVLCGALVMGAAPFVGRMIGGMATYPTLIGSLALMLPLFLLMPSAERLQEAPKPSADAPRSYAGIMLALGVLVLAMANAAIYAFCFVIGARTGLSPAALNQTMALAIPVALAGGALASVIGNRFGRTLPMTVGIAVLIVAAFAMTHSNSGLIFQVGMTLYLLSVYFVVPYFYGLAAAQDPSGQSSALVGASFLLAFAGGPYLGGIISQHLGFAPMAWIALAANLVAYGVFLMLLRGMRGVRPEAGAACPSS